MKLAGTLKCEIVKPIGASWDEVGARLRLLRRTVAPALTMTMRELYSEAMSALRAIKAGDADARKLQQCWQARVEKVLRANWTREIAAALEYDSKQAKKGKGLDPRTYLPAQEYLSAETRHNILARWVGKPFKDLLASRVSVPSWRTGAAVYARNRECPVSGDPDHAVLHYPLFGGGKKQTRLAVAPCGNGHRALWERLVSGELHKGRVGITYCKRKRKWYALISWVEECEVESAGTKRAAVNMGVNVMLQAVSESGDVYTVDGGDVLAARRGFAARRRSIQKSLDHMGRGSRGHGRKRRLLPLTKLDDAEHRYCETKNRQNAARLIEWCVEHRIGTLYLEDLTGIRDGDGARDEHANVMRLIHSWPFAEQRAAIEREGAERGVEVKAHPAHYDSQRCPRCGHTCEENSKQINGRAHFKRLKSAEGSEEVWERHDRRTVFKCVECGYRADGDLVAASNLLAEASGKDGAAEAAKATATKRARGGVKRGTKRGRNGQANKGKVRKGCRQRQSASGALA